MRVMVTTTGAAELRDRDHPGWVRGGPSVLTDFTAGTPALAACEPLIGAEVLELGCGTGYFARQLRRGGALVRGIDRSVRAIDRAREQEAREPLGVEYAVDDGSALASTPDRGLDLVLAMFTFDDASLDEERAALREIHRALRPGGKLVFCVTHPSLPFVADARPPIWFDPAGHRYYSARGHWLGGEVMRRDGLRIPLHYVHKTLEDHLAALRDAGFRGMPDMRELRVTADLLAIDPAFFGAAFEWPLHLLFRARTSPGI